MFRNGSIALLASVTAACAGGRSAKGGAGVEASSSAVAVQNVNVIDIATGQILPEQTVVIEGTRIHTVGAQHAIRAPEGATVVDGRGKYLIPGLWDMHAHLDEYAGGLPNFYRALIAYGVTGIREAGTVIPLDTLLRWRREIAAGLQIGPRQLFSGPSIKGRRPRPSSVEDARRVVDSLKAAGADLIKARSMGRELYLAVINRAREIGLPFGGHLALSLDSVGPGFVFIDHPYGVDACIGGFATVERCAPIAERFRQQGTWIVPTMVASSGAGEVSDSAPIRSPTSLEVAQRVGLGILTGTDAATAGIPWIMPGASLHAELRLLVASGMTPLAALQAGTLNPAKALKATDSLGTIAAGKLADLVLLDGNPLVDIRNTSKIHTVFANGRYVNRAGLDKLLATTKVAKTPP